MLTRGSVYLYSKRKKLFIVRISSVGCQRIELLICSHLQQRKKDLVGAKISVCLLWTRYSAFQMLAFVRAFIQQGTRQNVPLCSSTNQRRHSTQSSAIENNSWRVRSKFHPSIGWSARSHMPIVNCNVAGFSCLQMGHFVRYLKWVFLLWAPIRTIWF